MSLFHFARYKGDLKQQVLGAAVLKSLKSGDKVLISEGCTHHRQCNDIGSVKMPNWIKEYTNADIEFCFTSGGELQVYCNFLLKPYSQNCCGWYGYRLLWVYRYILWRYCIGLLIGVVCANIVVIKKCCLGGFGDYAVYRFE